MVVSLRPDRVDISRIKTLVARSRSIVVLRALCLNTTNRHRRSPGVGSGALPTDRLVCCIVGRARFSQNPKYLGNYPVQRSYRDYLEQWIFMNYNDYNLRTNNVIHTWYGYASAAHESTLIVIHRLSARGKRRVRLFGIFIIVYVLSSSKIYIAHLNVMVDERIMRCPFFENAFDPCSTSARLWLQHVSAHAYGKRDKFRFLCTIFVQNSEITTLCFLSVKYTQPIVDYSTLSNCDFQKNVLDSLWNDIKIKL